MEEKSGRGRVASRSGLFAHFLRLRGEPVTAATHRLQKLWPIGNGFDLLTQAADVDVHGAGSHEAVAAPDLVEQPIAVEDMPGVRSQIVQELEFQRTQLH